MELELDHLVVAAATLEEGVNHVCALVGCNQEQFSAVGKHAMVSCYGTLMPRPGRELMPTRSSFLTQHPVLLCRCTQLPPRCLLKPHPQFGTHNRCLGMEDGIYLEVIAVDPEAPPPSRPRWFGLDDPSMQVGGHSSAAASLGVLQPAPRVLLPRNSCLHPHPSVATQPPLLSLGRLQLQGPSLRLYWHACICTQRYARTPNQLAQNRRPALPLCHTQARLREQGPQLAHFVARLKPGAGADLKQLAAERPELVPPVVDLQRGDYSWSISVPADGSLPGSGPEKNGSAAGGLVPSLIQWHSAATPVQRLPPTGLKLLRLTARHRQADAINETLAALGADKLIRVEAAPSAAVPSMIAAIWNTTHLRGTRTLF